MVRILVLYFTGVGATEWVSRAICARLGQYAQADLLSVESVDIPPVEEYDALVVGTPCYHAAPARRMTACLKSLPKLKAPIPAFIFNTRGLCSLNTNRILAGQLRAKNISTVLDRAYRGPASDGALLAPGIGRFFAFEKDLNYKLNRDCAHFLRLLGRWDGTGYLPRFALGSILNAPNKAAGHLITLKIHLHKDRCVRCGQCIARCPHRAFAMDGGGYPRFDPAHCENCYRCIHHCPCAALSLNKRRTHTKLLRYSANGNWPPGSYLKTAAARVIL
ncbi:MAG: 4Fe-4S binding protein [Oscillospiraceae bacterium]|nr:4Fe-4S binding protein [Oscillospiraceae bacterium]